MWFGIFLLVLVSDSSATQGTHKPALALSSSVKAHYSNNACQPLQHREGDLQHSMHSQCRTTLMYTQSSTSKHHNIIHTSAQLTS